MMFKCYEAFLIYSRSVPYSGRKSVSPELSLARGVTFCAGLTPFTLVSYIFTPFVQPSHLLPRHQVSHLLPSPYMFWRVCVTTSKRLFLSGLTHFRICLSDLYVAKVISEKIRMCRGASGVLRNGQKFLVIYRWSQLDSSYPYP